MAKQLEPGVRCHHCEQELYVGQPMHALGAGSYAHVGCARFLELQTEYGRENLSTIEVLPPLTRTQAA
jgi:hypothetical protein